MESREIGATLLGLGSVSAVAFVALSRAVARRRTSHRDGAVRARFPKRRRRSTEKVVDTFGRLGKKWVHVPLSVAVGAYAWHRDVGAGSIAPPLASAAGLVASTFFEHAMPHRAPPPGRHSPTIRAFRAGTPWRRWPSCSRARMC